MNLIDKQLRKIEEEKRLGLMTHVVVGYPSLETTEFLVRVMEEAGVDFIELQIPFSDPLADGPIIMRACEKALENGTRVKDAFELASRLSKQVKISLIFMAYYNTVFKYGTKKFCQDAKNVGISGLIIPDIPLEEEQQEYFIKHCKEAGLKNIRVISPVSTLERLKKNAEVASGFVYCTARQGITGVKEELDPNIATFLDKVKKLFKIPVAVGFGISKREHLNQLFNYADIAVIGSAIIDVINKSEQNEIGKNINQFVSKEIKNFLINTKIE
ncbi:tryptophan synthase subunit alpha [Candidatus Daviesbacteria bacterium]|nr:tryptophan synthase subunit alpha [Candidatus Daviesbacteria bacterium]